MAIIDRRRDGRQLGHYFVDRDKNGRSNEPRMWLVKLEIQTSHTLGVGDV